MAAVIQLQEISYSYPRTSTPAIRGITLHIPEGQFVALIGPNGAGKSTLCYILAGFIPHFFQGDLRGQVTVAGLRTLDHSLSDLVLRVGLVFQNPFNQLSGTKLTVREEVAFGLENLGRPREEIRARVERVLEETGIAHLASRSPYALSAGQQQRVAIASVLVMQPQVLLLDEPTSQLDPVGTREVFAAVRGLSRRGMSVVMAEHKLEWVARFADRVVLLDQGRVWLDGSAREVLTSPLLAQHRLSATRYTLAAQASAEGGLWPSQRPLPVALEEAAEGFRAVRGMG